MINLLLAETANAGSSWWIYVVLIVLVAAMLILPSISNNKQRKAFNNMIENLHVGDEVRTIGGVIGRITKITKKDGVQTFILETGAKGNKTTMEFDIAAIGLVLKSTATAESKKEEITADVKAEKAEEVKPLANEIAEVKTEKVEEAKPANKVENKSTNKKAETKTSAKTSKAKKNSK